ncbi:hypothetical protein EXT67_20710 [Pectobacterium atrosepticum]|uniref:Uncharacterized protein n=1 Tax=Pectobacterium phage phiTE TaxID=1116482 RepID=K9L471_9CAUD|nr:hypothetical protein [Pectobacterium atrosepticum]YP_007392509.1 hypothetical protein phiTE_047 [Pectobacterium phage phiTE]AEZ66213.1 hypothetical protein phiTE_047 [Pectobacterium phage phiTE]MCL6318727.1 hypothetical protein [Pectobacterium atrosepticum]
MSKEEHKPYPKQRPTIRDEAFGSGNDRIIQEHPAYGRITLTHPSGGNTEMFGSNIVHNERIALRIDLGYEETAYDIPNYRSQPQSRGGRVVELEMTAYQWAGLVASHSGNGVPCTLRYITPHGTGSLPLIDGQNTSTEQANREIEGSLKAMMKRHAEGLDALSALIAKGKANKGELQAAMKKFQTIHAKLPEVTAYALYTFTEHSEAVMARANAEIEASLNSLITRTGIKALGMKPLELEDKG